MADNAPIPVDVPPSLAPARRPHTSGRGALSLARRTQRQLSRRYDVFREGHLERAVAIRALPDLCVGIVSERLESLWTFSPLD
jgi:hypothetical protein